MKNTFSVPINIKEQSIIVNVTKSDFSQFNYQYNAHSIFDQYPGVYCFFDQKSIYIGESTHPWQRINEHCRTGKFNHKDQLMIFQSKQFHKSAIYDIETKLIAYIDAEQKLYLRNQKINQNDHKYFLKHFYQKVMSNIWQYLQQKQISYASIATIENSQTYKLSPYKSLNIDQTMAVNEVTNQLKNQMTIIKGYPGTGKSIVASQLYKRLSQKYNVCLTSGTTHTLQAFKNVFKFHQKKLITKSQIWPPSKIIRSQTQFDVIIIDEGHRLSKKSGKGHPLKYAHIPKNEDELMLILKKGKNIVLLYDHHQVVHDGDFNFSESDFPQAKVLTLHQQMRSQNGYDYIEWFMKWLDNKFEKLKTNRDYELKIFDNFTTMYQHLLKKSQTYPLTRLLSGYTRPWRSKKDDTRYDFEIDGIKLKWNNSAKVKSKKWFDSNPAQTLKEVAYYHTIQGFDLQYAGIIIGQDLFLDQNGDIQIKSHFVKHNNQKPKKDDPFFDQKLRKWVINRYKILLSRGALGTYIYVEDKKLRAKLQSLLN